MKDSLQNAENPYGAWLLRDLDLRNISWWLTYDPIHEPEPLVPLAGCLWAELHQYGYCAAAESISYPFSHGVLCRINQDGYMALSAPLRTSPDEEKSRSVKFYELVNTFLNDFSNLWSDFRYNGKIGLYLKEIIDNYSRIGALNSEKWCFNVKFLNKLSTLGNSDLLDFFFKYIDILRSHWKIHFIIMYPSFYLYSQFERFMEETFGINDKNPAFQRLMQGFDNKISNCTLQLVSLARQAKDRGLKDIFESHHDLAMILKSLEKMSKEWIDNFYNFLQTYGVRSDNPFDLYKETWLENPLKPLELIRKYVLADEDITHGRYRVIEEREKMVNHFLKRLHGDQSEKFTKLLKAAQNAYCWNEDHNYWIEYFGFAIMRYIILEMGRRLQTAGCVRETTDIFFLNPQELDSIFLPAIYKNLNLSDIVEKRKISWLKAFSSNKKPPIISGGEVAVKENPIFSKLFGVPPPTIERAGPDIIGYPGSPGKAIGEALVITELNQMYQIRRKCILVIPSLNPAWASIIPFLKGLITDFGGTLSHAAIICREFGIPAVVGTITATKVIKSGQTIRIDGDKGYVWIIKGRGCDLNEIQDTIACNLNSHN